MKPYLFSCIRRRSIEVLILLLLTAELWASSSIAHSFTLNLPDAQEPIKCFETEGGFLVFAQEKEQGRILAIELDTDLHLKKLVALDRVSFTKLNDVTQDILGGFVLAGYEIISKQSRIKIAILDEKLSVVFQHSVPVSGADQWAESLICEEKDLIIVGGHRTTGSNWYDALVMRIDHDGEILWSKRVGGSSDEWFSGVCKLNGKYLCFGSTESYGNGQADFWGCLFSENGNRYWCTTFGGQRWERAIGCARMHDSVVLVGSSNSFTSQNSLFAVKVDPYGRTVWQKTIDLGNDFTTKGALTHEDIVLVYGELWQNDTRRDITYLLLDQNGELIAQRTLREPNDQRVVEIVPLESKRMLILAASDNPHSSTDIQLYLIQQDIKN